MSLPTERLHRLSIGSDMPERRSLGEGPARPDHSESGQIESSSEESESEEEVSTEMPTIQGSSGIKYSLDRLDRDAEARALVGLTSEFDITTCSRGPTGYHFQLSEHQQVHIGPDGYTCTCSTFFSRPNVACQHIFWLLDQLHGYFNPPDPSDTIPLSSDGHPPGLPRTELLLTGKLELVANQLSWPYVRSESEGGMNRPQKVKDIITAFSTTILREDFRPDLTDDTAHSRTRTPEQCVVQGDFEATMFRLATHDDAVYSRLCKAMPPGACAAIYFDKIQGKSRKLLADFDRYAQTGQLPTDDTDDNNNNPTDVNHVLHKIQLIVCRIEQNILARAPHGSEGAAKALVTLLEDICSRNKDALDGNRWGRTTFHGEDEDHRNLYHQLIGSAEETGRFFVLDALEHLPAAALHQFRDRLMAVQRKVEVNRAPKAYILKLGGLVRRAEAVPALGQKRSSTAAPRGQSKRTR